MSADKKRFAFCFLLLTFALGAAACADNGNDDTDNNDNGNTGLGRPPAPPPPGAELSLSLQSLVFASGSGEHSFDVFSNREWSATCKSVGGVAGWCSVSPTSGSGDGSVQVRVARNDSDADRYATVELTTTDGTLSRAVSVAQPSAETELSVRVEEVVLGWEGEGRSFNVSSDRDWDVSCTGCADIFTVEPKSGNGNKHMTVSVAQNNGTAVRVATLTIHTETLSRTVRLMQPPQHLGVYPESLAFSLEGGEKSFRVFAEGEWSASCSAEEWCKVTPSGSGDGEVSVSVDSNSNSTNTRTANVEITAGTHSRTVRVTQSPATLNVSPTNLEFGTGGGEKTFNVSSNTDWRASCSAEAWCTVVSPTYDNHANGNGDGTVSVRVSSNGNTTERTATVTITAGIRSETVRVVQDAVPTELNVSETILEFGFRGGESTLIVSSNTDWVASCSAASWCPVLSTPGNGTVGVQVDPNYTAFERTATVTITAGTVTRTVRVRQAPRALSVTPEILEFGFDGGESTLIVRSDTEWFATCQAVWCNFQPPYPYPYLYSYSGSGDGTVEVRVNPNTTVAERTTTLRIEAGAVIRTVNVRQAAGPPTLSVSSELLEFNYMSGGRPFNVISNTSWSASCESDSESDENWCTVTPTDGSGDRTVTVRATTNSATTERTATVTITAGTLTRTVDVRQAAGPLTLTVSPTGLTFGSGADEEVLNVRSNTSWTATACTGGSDWCSVTPTSGSGNETVTVRVTENSGYDDRTATVTLETTSGAPSRTVNITQLTGMLRMDSFSPTEATHGTTLSIVGRNFSTTPTNNVVRFNGIEAVVVSASATQLTVTVPQDINSSGHISITVDGRTVSSASTFTYLPASTVTTLAGSTRGFENGIGSDAQFARPQGITQGADGNLYVADWDNFRIRRVTPTGAVTTLASWPSSLIYPQGITQGADGNFYVTANNEIYRVTPEGEVTSIAGSTSGFENGTGSAARFSNPQGITTGADGNLYVADMNNNRIRRVTPDGVVTTLAGSTQGFEDGTGSAAQFYWPYGITTSADGNLYVADTYNNRIRRVTLAGVVTTLAGDTQGFADGTGSAAQFYWPQGISASADGNLYVADTYNHRIRKVTLAGVVTALAGSTQGFEDGTGSTAQFSSPSGLTQGADGSLYVADTSNHRIRKITVE